MGGDGLMGFLEIQRTENKKPPLYIGFVYGYGESGDFLPITHHTRHLFCACVVAYLFLIVKSVFQNKKMTGR